MHAVPGAWLDLNQRSNDTQRNAAAAGCGSPCPEGVDQRWLAQTLSTSCLRALERRVLRHYLTGLSDGFAASAAQIGIEAQSSYFRGVRERQVLEQRGMAGLSDATILPAIGAPRPVPPNEDRVIETSIPSRLDSLRWSGFHTRIVIALGITWILDGLEVTLAGALSGGLKERPTKPFTNLEGGFFKSAYLAVALLGGLRFACV